jgi:membrane fusion protein, copper/silver efflux system
MNDNHYDPDLHEPLPEGEEAPPPLTHTMSIVRWAILIGLSLFAFTMILSSLGFAPWEARADDTTQYHCPMHPTYISNQLGDCPICGMSLVPIDKAGKEIKEDSKVKKAETAKAKIEKTKAAEKVVYTCPMHPEVISDKPGECPKCGMDLVKMEIPSSDSTSVQKIEYACPMHPDVISDKPAECPKCGMDLVKVENKPEKAPEIRKAIDTKAAYYCPMHPDVTSDEPGRCPQCKMFLVPAKSDTTSTGPAKTGMAIPDNNSDMSDMGKAPVNGLVPVTIEPERLQLIGLKTGKAEYRSIGGGTELLGYITPDESRIKNVTTRVSGWAQTLFVNQTGQYIEAGKPLLSIYSQELYQAEQDFMVARNAVNGKSSDQSLGEMRKQIYGAARERLILMGLNDDQINEIEKLESPSTQIMIKSPFSGYILEKSILQGQYIGPEQNLFTIADLSKVWVIGDIYEKDIANIKTGQKVYMKLTAFPGEVFVGAISYIYPTVSRDSRTLKIRLIFDNSDFRLKPGMYAEINIDNNGESTIAIPNDAVLDGGNEQYVFVVHDGRHFEPRLVKVGHSSDDYTEILSGLDSGETVVTSANFLIDSESRLKAAVAGMSNMNISSEHSK